MALQKASQRIPLGASLRTDVDDKLLPLGNTLELENAYQIRGGEVVKRFGTNGLSTSVFGGGSLPQSHALAAFKGALVSLSVPGAMPLLEYSSSAAKWVAASGSRRGPMAYTEQAIASAAMAMDVAYSSGYYFVTYRDTHGTADNVVQTAIEASTGVRMFSRTVNGTAVGVGCRVGIANGYAVFVYVTGGNITCDSYNIASLPSTPTTTATIAGSGTAKQIDVRTTGTILQVVYTNGGNIAALDLVPSTGTITGWSPRDAGGAVIASPTAITWVLDFGGSGKVALATTNGVYWNFPLSGATRNAANVTAFGGVSFANNQAVTAYTIDATSTGNGVVLGDDNSVKTVTAIGFSNGAIGAGPTVVARSVVLGSKAWTYGGDAYVTLAHITTQQYTRYAVNTPMTHNSWAAPLACVPLASIAPLNGTQSGTGINVLCSVPTISANTFALGIDIARSLEAALLNTGPITGDGIGVDLILMSHGTVPNTTLSQPREAIDNLLVPGAALGAYDGSIYGQAGFAYNPDPLPNPTLAGGGGLTAGATYFWRLVYRRMDAAGRIWRSAPSVIKSAAMGANTSASFAAPTLRLTEYDITIELYRGAANDSNNFQLVGTVANSRTADTVTILDLSSDTQIATGEELYTNGGILQNDTAPGFSCSCIGGNRHFGVPMNDKQSIWPSNEFVIGQGLRQSISNVFDVKDQHGDINALAALDDKVVIFKGDIVYAANGVGPDALGRGVFNLGTASIGIGTTNPQSVVETKDGIMFRSTSQKAGYFIVDRGLNVHYVGAPVQKYMASTCVASVLVPSLSQVRFYLDIGTVLVYDFGAQDLQTQQYGVWSIFTIATTTTATVWSGAAVLATTVATIYVEDLTGATYADNGGGYTMKVATPWINLAGLRGYERLYSITGVGSRVTSHTLTIALYADYDDSAAVRTFTVSPGVLWDWQLRYSKKFTAFKIVLTESSSSAGAKMSALEAEYGLRKSSRPLAASKRAA